MKRKNIFPLKNTPKYADWNETSWVIRGAEKEDKSVKATR